MPTQRRGAWPLPTWLVVIVFALACQSSTAEQVPERAALGSIPLSTIDGRTTPTSFTLSIDVAGAASATVVVDGAYIGKDDVAPLQIEAAVAAGAHRSRVRTVDRGGTESRVDATFTAGGAPPPSGRATTTTALAEPPTAAGAEIVVDTVDGIRAALASAAPGAVIRVADGEYSRRGPIPGRCAATSSAGAERRA